MDISFSDILQAGVGVIALALLYVYMQNTSKDNERRDKADAFEREQRVKDNQQFMLLFATLTSKYAEGTTSIVKSGVDSEGRMSSQLSSAENNIKGRVAASADANTAAFEKVYKLMDNAFRIALARPPDPQANDKYDQALAILTAQMQVVQDDLQGVRSDTAANTDARHTAEMAAVAVPSEVIVTDVSPSAIESIMGAVAGNGDAADTEGDLPIASGQ